MENTKTRCLLIDIIKENSKEEFENSNGIWELAKESEYELVCRLENIINYYKNLIR